MTELPTSEDALTRAETSQHRRSLVSWLTPAGWKKAVRAGRDATDLLPRWSTPCEWIDDQGLFVGTDGAWLFHELPAPVFSADSFALPHVFEAILGAHGEREMHLLTYGWEEPARAAETATSEAADYASRALRMLVPRHVFVAGVKLDVDPAVLRQQARVRGVFTDVVDKSLAEWVPAFDGWEADRDRVAATLAHFGGTPVQGTALSLLESWYTLGISDDINAVERDDAITVGDSVIELVSLRSFTEGPQPTSGTGDDTRPQPVRPLTAGENGVTVISARGLLQNKSVATRHGETKKIALTSASVLFGRRARRPRNTLEDELRARPGIEHKRLPLNQVPALDETLPTSTTRIDPNVTRLDATNLATLGFQEPLPAGDRAGLYVGLVDPGLSYPLFLDVFSTPGYILDITGGPESGKTFLADHLALQAALSHKRLVYLTRDAKSVPAAASHVIDTPVQGLLDPMARFTGDFRWQAATHLLTQLVPDAAAQRDVVQAGLRQAAALDLDHLGAAVKLIGDTTLVARLLRFLSTPEGRLVNAKDPAPARPRVQVWEPRSILADVKGSPHAGLFGDLLCAAAVASSPSGIVVSDESGTWYEGTLAGAAFAAMGSATAIITTRTTSPTAPAPAYPGATRILLSCPEEASAPVLRAAGVKNSAALAQWLSGSAPVLGDGTVDEVAGGLLVTAEGLVSALLVGPVPVEELRALTRGAAIRYAHA